jgi:methyl-accepting chemotaxis protein
MRPDRPAPTARRPLRRADWNAANCRNRRIFDDKSGLLASRNQRPVLVQTYERTVDRRTKVLMKEFDVPVHIGERHWGAVRLAVSF